MPDEIWRTARNMDLTSSLDACLVSSSWRICSALLYASLGGKTSELPPAMTSSSPEAVSFLAFFPLLSFLRFGGGGPSPWTCWIDKNEWLEIDISTLGTGKMHITWQRQQIFGNYWQSLSPASITSLALCIANGTLQNCSFCKGPAFSVLMQAWIA